MHSKHINISVTVVYTPTEDAETSKRDYFYRESNDVQSGLPVHDINWWFWVILMLVLVETVIPTLVSSVIGFLYYASAHYRWDTF